jgi:hypothetical protein
MNIRIDYNLQSKDYREGDSTVKKTLSDLALPLHVVDELLEKCTHLINNSVYHNVYFKVL